MKRGDFTGIDGIPAQDMAMWELMGAIVDRTKDYLGASDLAVAQFRRQMVAAARRMRDGGPAIGTAEPRVPRVKLASFEGIVAEENRLARARRVARGNGAGRDQQGPRSLRRKPMLSVEESTLLTRVGPGSTMGDFMRQYWIPAAKSSELVADGAPVRLMLLGEQLIAFRDSAGRVGVMDHRCPHRCASLFFGRNEEDGLRCVYHGWKYDVDGICLDMANVPPHQDFKDKVRAKAYPACERNGVVWTYMGPRKEPPPLPAIEAALMPVGKTAITFVQRECNWLQAIEGDIDTSHFGFLHAGHLDYRNSRPTIRTTTPCSAARPNTIAPRPIGAPCTRPIATPTPTTCITAGRNISSRSGPRFRKAISSITSTRAPGSRWTTPTRCS